MSVAEIMIEKWRVGIQDATRLHTLYMPLLSI